MQSSWGVISQLNKLIEASKFSLIDINGSIS